jgi:hypothetical protein
LPRFSVSTNLLFRTFYLHLPLPRLFFLRHSTLIQITSLSRLSAFRLLQSRHAAKAAQSLGLPFAPALVGFENKGSVRGSVRGSVGGSVGGSVRGSVGGSVRGSVGGSVGGSVEVVLEVVLDVMLEVVLEVVLEVAETLFFVVLNLTVLHSQLSERAIYSSEDRRGRCVVRALFFAI